MKERAPYVLRRLSELMTGTGWRGAYPEWQNVMVRAGGGDPAQEIQQRDAARRNRARADLAARAAEARLRAQNRPPPLLPDGAVWVQRPAAWHQAAEEPIRIGPQNGARITPELTLFHDCPRAEMVLRQALAPGSAPAPFFLILDTLHFEGSFLSLVTSLPETEAAALSNRDILRVELTMTRSAPSKLYGRLNMEQGPNTAQMLAEFSEPADGSSHVAFDLAYGGLRDQPVDRAWIDLIVERPAMMRLTLQDMLLSRYPRAEL